MHYPYCCRYTSKSRQRKGHLMFLTILEAAPRLGMHPDTIRRMIRDREIAAVKGPHRNSPYRISEDEVTRWLADHANTASDIPA
jgi:excisionase family DNA binding protein